MGDGDSDDQTTPRASLAGLTIFPDRRTFSRDDTAADLSDQASTTGLKGFPLADLMRPEEQLSAWSQEERLAHFRAQRRPSKQMSFGASSRTQSAASAESQLDAVAMGVQKVPHNATSLGRRLSRNYKELKDGFTKHATLPGRSRRSSTPYNLDTTQQLLPAGERTVNPQRLQLVAPLSPSKRNARYNDSRAKKLRHTFGLGSECRKDTPAPAATKLGAVPTSIPSLPYTRAAAAASIYQLQGGDNARQSAAAMARSQSAMAGQHAASFMEEQLEEKWSGEDLHTRRGRVGSLSSAADSGADLSSYGDGEEYRDSCTDPEAMDVDDAEYYRVLLPKKIDVAHALPSELALQVFQYLDAADLRQCNRVSRIWQEFANDKSVWRHVFLRRWGYQPDPAPAPQSVLVGGAGIGRPNQPNQEWKAMYQARIDLEANWRRGAEAAGKAVYLSGHTDSVYCVQFDEEKIITGSRDRTIRVWDINTFQCLHVIGGPNVRPVLGPKVLRTVDYPSFHVATASVNGTAYGNNIFQEPSQYHDASILCLQYDEHILVTGSSDSDLIVWDIHTYQPIARLSKHTGGVLDVALDAKHIVSCSKDSRIIVWDRATYQPRGELTGHRGPVNAVQLRGKYLVSASGDGIARLFDLDTMKLVKEFSAKERGLAAVEFSEDMKYVLAGGNDHITYKFERETGKEVMQFTGHTQLVRSLWLDSANARVVSGSYDLDLRVYDFETGAEIWRAEEWTTSWMLAAKSDYRRIVATSQDGRVLIVDFGLRKGGLEDGRPMDGVELLRGKENTSAIKFRNPWTGVVGC